jgi:hypothetical protein
MKRVILLIAAMALCIGSAKAGFTGGNGDPGSGLANGTTFNLYDDTIDANFATLGLVGTLPIGGTKQVTVAGTTVTVVAVDATQTSEANVFFRQTLAPVSTAPVFVPGWVIFAEHDGALSANQIAADTSTWSDLVHFQNVGGNWVADVYSWDTGYNSTRIPALPNFSTTPDAWQVQDPEVSVPGSEGSGYGGGAFTLYAAQTDPGGDKVLYNLESVVPEPTTMIAGALLLLPFGASTLRMLRKNRAE